MKNEYARTRKRIQKKIRTDAKRKVSKWIQWINEGNRQNKYEDWYFNKFIKMEFKKWEKYFRKDWWQYYHVLLLSDEQKSIFWNYFICKWWVNDDWYHYNRIWKVRKRNLLIIY